MNEFYDEYVIGTCKKLYNGKIKNIFNLILPNRSILINADKLLNIKYEDDPMFFNDIQLSISYCLQYSISRALLNIGLYEKDFIKHLLPLVYHGFIADIDSKYLTSYLKESVIFEKNDTVFNLIVSETIHDFKISMKPFLDTETIHDMFDIMNGNIYKGDVAMYRVHNGYILSLLELS